MAVGQNCSVFNLFSNFGKLLEKGPIDIIISTYANIKLFRGNPSKDIF